MSGYKSSGALFRRASRDGKCPRCGQQVNAGDMAVIAWGTDSGGWHPDCWDERNKPVRCMPLQGSVYTKQDYEQAAARYVAFARGLVGS